MNIELPEKFARFDKRGKVDAFIENGILKMRFDVSFKSLMKDIVHFVMGNRCFYCKNVMRAHLITVDHIFPQDIGGPTITNNLVPACRICNNDKQDMNLIQYMRFLKKKDKNAKWKYLKKARLENEELKRDKKFSFLKDLGIEVIEMNLEDVKGYQENGYNKTLEGTLRKKGKRKDKYTKIDEFYQKYGRLKKAIIVDRNNRLLGGFTSLMYAKNNHLNIIPVIKLDNVEIFY